MSEIAFRRINGRIVPIKVSKEEQRRAQARVAAAGGIAAASAYATGRLAPPGGMASAPKRVKRMGKFKIARGTGLAFLGASVFAGDNLAEALGYEDPTTAGASVAGTAAAYYGGRKLAKLGRVHQRSAALKWALRFKRIVPKI